MKSINYEIDSCYKPQKGEMILIIASYDGVKFV